MAFKHLLVTTIFYMTTTSVAGAYCSEPSAPSCASAYGQFSDEWEFESCKREMEGYKSEIEDFAECNQREVDEANEQARKASADAEALNSEAIRKVESATSEYSDAVSSFNRRAGN